MEQFRKFLRDKGFVLALLACLVAAAAAGVWAVRTVRDELKENLDGLKTPDSTSTLPGIDQDLTLIPEEEYPEWQQPDTPAANSVANVPKAEPPSASSSSPSSGAASGSGSVREPSALQGGSSSASSSAAAASTQPGFGKILNGYSGDELVYNKTLGDWRTHNGIDYAAKAGEAVPAPVAGSVVLAGSDGSWGPTVAIKDDAGRIWRLCGVASPKVKEGDIVAAGQTLGKVGSVGCECAEEDHIHLEVKPGGADRDPTTGRNENRGCPSERKCAPSVFCSYLTTAAACDCDPRVF